MTKESAEFLFILLGQVTLNAGAPDFDEVAERMLAARAELKAIISA